ncbi:uncharacterized protein N7518_005096 [Penicillium psychrosexuale]|uniref:uncharacterized protein n=1 Tax=Penicillium psychrosexuale TaxID=1002107 RepID=UPI00254582F4|nr:uncharacterized protein N7518_005096 [Penicillium psychrosexuale]KAJ5796556.1 hypothetical protein N7518_005096 [Penicillium psychrosexuale]
MANESVRILQSAKKRKAEEKKEVVQILLFLFSISRSPPRKGLISGQGDESNKARQSQTESSWTQNLGSRTEREDSRLSAFWYIEGDLLSSSLLSETDG